jgi:photosystem II stability/assembly factor-like uncharacterized protein
MQIVRNRFSVTLLLVVMCTIATAQVRSMKLLTAQIGWAETSDRLFWTANDGGEWRDITPNTASKGVISSVFFLDTSTGWVVFVYGDRSDEAHFELASTANSGKDWSVAHLIIPHLNQRQFPVSGPSRMDFVDNVHGWIDLDLESNANFRAAILLATTDGGKTWDWAPKSPGVAGRIYFVDTENGWLAGGPGDQKLYATYDGSKSWQEVLLKAPAEARPATDPTYDRPPVCSDPKHCFLAVTYSGPEDSPSALVLFASEDSVRTWIPSRIVSGLKTSSRGQIFPSVIADSTLITASMSGHTPALVTVPPGVHSKSANAELDVPDSPFLQLSFVSPDDGWILSNGKLLSTSDGGETWANVTPSRGTDKRALRGEDKN